MVHSGEHHSCASANYIIQGLAENQGCSLVFTPCSLCDNGYHLCNANIPCRPEKPVSVVICTYGRPDSLNDTLKSLLAQTYKHFEVILITEKGNLASLRDKGLRMAKGAITAFIDDDVYCEPTWAESVLECFRTREIVGVTGPTEITDEYKKNRDIFKYKTFKKFYDRMFLDNQSERPSYLSQTGTPSTASNNPGITYNGEAGYLEACNFAVRRQEAIRVGGFSKVYTGTSEWSEVDLALRLKARGTLWFCQKAKLYHRPSQAGVYVDRLKTRHRWRNFIVFQRQWVKPSIKQKLYWAWIWIYLTLKNIGLI